MKKTCILRLKQQVILVMICLFLSNMQLHAQTWFPLGSEWTYTTYIPSEGKNIITKVNAIRDTSIEGKVAIILKGSSNCSACKTENIFYYDSLQQIVYQYLDNHFKPYFDFSKQIGESYYMYFYSSMIGSMGYDSVLISIDSIVTYMISDINVRFQYISISANSHYSFSGPIIEFIGSKEGFYPEDKACDFSVFRGLRCYSDSILTYYTDSIFQAKGCDFDVSIPDVNFSEMLKLYPNPFFSEVILENSKELIKEVRVYDLIGRLIKHFSIDNFYSILNLGNLQNGMYIMKIYIQNESISKIIIKQ